MSDYNAKIRAKGLESTGVTEQLAKAMYDNVGGHYVAIVDLRVARHAEDDDGNRAVELVIDAIEPVVDGKLNGTLVDHVREIQRALYRNRKLAENGNQGELPLDGDDEPAPKVADVLAHGQSLLEHDDDGSPVLWDGDADDQDEDESANPDDLAYEPHEFVDNGSMHCTVCDGPPDWDVHQVEPEGNAA